MAKDKRATMSTDMNEDVDLMSEDAMTDQEREALQRELADADKRAKMHRKPSM